MQSPPGFSDVHSEDLMRADFLNYGIIINVFSTASDSGSFFRMFQHTGWCRLSMQHVSAFLLA